MIRAQASLSDRGVRGLKPQPQRYFVWDADVPGFGVRVSPSGQKAWLLRFRHAGRRPQLKLGDFPTVPLSKARELARKRLASVTLGTDPTVERDLDRAAPTFGRLASVYLEKHAPKKRSAREDRRIIERELLPPWRTTQAKAIRRVDVVALLDEIAARPAPVMANRTLALVRKLFNFGIEKDLVEINPCVHIPRPGGKEQARDRVLSEGEIRGLWLGLDNEAPSLQGALRMLLLTAQRRGEVLRMRWQDLSEGGWTIPAEHSKNGLQHRVPLSSPALAILEALRPMSALGPWVFPGRLEGKHVSNIERSLDRARERQALAHFTPHDLRRTAASFMTGLGIPRLTVKKVLGHLDDKRDVTAVYDRHSYDPEKRQALEGWGRRVLEIVTGARAESHVVLLARG